MKKSLYLLSTLVIGLLLNFQFARAQVVPEVTVIQPSEMGIEWVIGNTYLISWTDNFTMPVDIYLVDDDFGSTGNDEETLIGEDVEGSTFAWEIDGSFFPSNFCKIRVESSVNGAYNDDSQEYFKLLANASNASMLVEQPSLPNIDWVIGQTYLISWVDNIPGNVNIDLMETDEVTLVGSIATDREGSTFLWNTTGFAAGTYKVRVSSLDGAVVDFSDNDFELVASLPGTIELLQPTANNTQILVGSTYLISWIDTFSEDVKIELTSNDVDYYEIEASVEGSTYLWNTATLPAGHLIADGGAYKIKVSSTIAGTYDDSEFAFTAVSSTGSEVTVIQPSEQNIEWLLGGQYLISWIDNFSGNVNIELWDEFGAAGAKIEDIATNVPGSTYIWNTAINPAALDPGSYTIKITNSAGTIADFSDNAFDIVAGTGSSIEVLQPNIAGINWVVGSSHLISWIDDVSNSVDIELVGSAPFTIAYDNADNYGLSWADGDNEGYGFGPWDLRVVNDNGGILEFFVGDPALGSLPGMDNPSWGMIARSNPADMGNAIEAYREFDSPLELENTFSFDYGVYGGSGAKGFVLYAGGEFGDELLEVSIENSTAVTITQNAITTTMFNNIGNDFMHFTFEYLISGDLRVMANSRNGIEPDFDHTYTINAAPDAIKFKAAGQLDDVNYLVRAGYINNLKIQTYIADIATDVEGSTYVWNTTGYGAGTYKIRVKSGDVEDESDNTFNLVASAGGTITFESPLPDAQWVKGASYWVSWNDTYMEPLDIYLRRGANGVDYNVQLKNDFEGSAFVYDVVAPEAEDYYIYIASSTDPIKHHESGLFDIVESAGGTLTFNQPVLNDIWVKGYAYVISWEDTFMEPLNVYLKNDDAIFPVNISLQSSFNGTSFDYLVPAGVTVPAQDEYYIYIESSTDPANYSFTSDFFEVVLSGGGTLTFNQPVLNDTWIKGSAYFISWEDTFMEPLNVYLKNDDAVSPVNITLKTAFNGTTFDYLVPTGATVPAQDEYYIYIESSTDPANYNFTSDFFEVVLTEGGTGSFFAPLAGATWTKGLYYWVSWEDTYIEPLNIWLKNDVGGTAVNIEVKHAFLGSAFDYQVPTNNTVPVQGGYYFYAESSLDNSYSFISGLFNIAAPVAASVYPNPAKDFVSINFDENVSGSFDAVLYDRFNNQMMNFTLDATTKSHRISTAQLPEGVYFLRMTSGSNTIAQKIIVQH